MKKEKYCRYRGNISIFQNVSDIFVCMCSLCDGERALEDKMRPAQPWCCSSSLLQQHQLPTRIAVLLLVHVLQGEQQSSMDSISPRVYVHVLKMKTRTAANGRIWQVILDPCGSGSATLGPNIHMMSNPAQVFKPTHFVSTITSCPNR